MSVPRLRFSAVVFLSILLLATPAVAKDGVGTPSGGGASISWQIKIQGHQQIVLLVSAPDGQVYTHEYGPGKDPSFHLADLEDIEDGEYSYELRVIPKVSENVKRQLAQARAQNDEKAARKIRKAAGLLESVVQSGAFTVLNGSIVSPNQAEAGGNQAQAPSTSSAQQFGGVSADSREWTPVVNDQVIPDDLIVQGSGCFGFDCVNNENFGFDTIKLKENNLRIKAEDTSAGSFPTNDWQLTFNDSASGGANKFSVEDITGAKVPMTITAGAATNSMFIDSASRVGFRTSTPVLDLHVSTSNTPGLRLEQTNAGGFTAQTWDVAGNEANFFVRDLTSGSRLPFRIRPGAPTSSIDISGDGDVGIGTASPNANARLDVNDSVQTKARLALTGQEYFMPGITSTDGVAFVLGVNRTGNRQLWLTNTDTMDATAANGALRFFPALGHISSMAMDGATTKPLLLNVAGGNVGIATIAPSFPLQVGDSGAGDGNGAHVTTGGVWTNGSSREFKENIQELNAVDAQEALAALQPVRYTYKKEPGEEYIGFIAEEVPALVAQSYDPRYLSPMDIVATLTKVVQEQQKAIDALNAKIEKLEKANGN